MELVLTNQVSLPPNRMLSKTNHARSRICPELREYIFKLAIIEKDKIGLILSRRGSPIPTYKDRDVPFTGLELARTCRQFRQEALPLFYEDNMISLELWADERIPKDSIPDHMRAIDVVTVHVDDSAYGREHCYVSRISIEQLSGFTLEIIVSGYLEEICMCALEELARDCRGKNCMREFLNEFERRGLRERYRCSWFETQFRGSICGDCGKIQIPRFLVMSSPYWRPMGRAGMLQRAIFTCSRD